MTGIKGGKEEEVNKGKGVNMVIKKKENEKMRRSKNGRRGTIETNDETNDTKTMKKRMVTGHTRGWEVGGRGGGGVTSSRVWW